MSRDSNQNDDRNKMIPDYFETRFFYPGPPNDFGGEFGIISAYATTGETWTDDRNLEADSQLEKYLNQRATCVSRITGYSPSTEHKEPSWLADVAFEEACDIGLEYLQDAIYYVSFGKLYVSYCDGRREMFEVGSFESRVDSNSKRA